MKQFLNFFKAQTDHDFYSDHADPLDEELAHQNVCAEEQGQGSAPMPLFSELFQHRTRKTISRQSTRPHLVEEGVENILSQKRIRGMAQDWRGRLEMALRGREKPLLWPY